MKRLLLLAAIAIVTFTSCNNTSIKQKTFLGICIGQSFTEFNRQSDSLFTLGQIQKLIFQNGDDCLLMKKMTTFDNIDYYLIICPITQNNFVTSLKIFIKTENCYQRINNNLYTHMNGNIDYNHYLNQLEGGDIAIQTGSYVRSIYPYSDIKCTLEETYGKATVVNREDSVIINTMAISKDDGSISNCFKRQVAINTWNTDDMTIRLTRTVFPEAAYSYTMDIIYEPTAKFKKRHNKQYEKLKREESIF